jgi:aryl-alcohol dehydrogenase-like predicted oxidoreductase
MKALGVSERRGVQHYVSQQIYYSLVAREAEYELVPIALTEGAGIIVWSPLAMGFLSGKFSRGAPSKGGTRRSEWGDPHPIDEERGFAIIDAMREIASNHGASVPQVALNWVRRRPGVDSVIIGARDEQQLGDNLAAATWELNADEGAMLDELSEPPLIYPYWHQQEEVAERFGPADRWPRTA